MVLGRELPVPFIPQARALQRGRPAHNSRCSVLTRHPWPAPPGPTRAGHSDDSQRWLGWASGRGGGAGRLNGTFQRDIAAGSWDRRRVKRCMSPKVLSRATTQDARGLSYRLPPRSWAGTVCAGPLGSLGARLSGRPAVRIPAPAALGKDGPARSGRLPSQPRAPAERQPWGGSIVFPCKDGV